MKRAGVMRCFWKDLEVWNQQVRDLEKRKSIQVHDLQRIWTEQHRFPLLPPL